MMPIDSDLTALLSQFKAQFHWNETLGFWWLESKTYNGQRWQSAYNKASDENLAKAGAVEYLKGFSEFSEHLAHL
jgi:hypothetical protein